ncbi:MAG: PilZ domain-containing protein [Thiohalomonadaceae bacterium]
MFFMENRRQASRLLRDEDVRVKIISAPAQPELIGSGIESETIDVSATGLRLLLEVALAVGSRLELLVMVGEQGREYRLVGDVVWRRETESAGVYLVGIKLLSAKGFELESWCTLFG